MTDQYVHNFDYKTYRQAVALRVEAEHIGSPMLFERAAALFVALDMQVAADGWTNGVQYATELTNSILANGWAKRASGPYAAILVEPLETVAGRYGVSL